MAFDETAGAPVPAVCIQRSADDHRVERRRIAHAACGREDRIHAFAPQCFRDHARQALGPSALRTPGDEYSHRYTTSAIKWRTHRVHSLTLCNFLAATSRCSLPFVELRGSART